MDELLPFLQILCGGGVAAGITGLFHYFSQRRQQRYLFSQKMIARIIDLIERYYEQLSKSCSGLRRSLKATCQSSIESRASGYDFLRSFYWLLMYLHHANRLAEERPIPLFADFSDEHECVKCIQQIYDTILFDDFQISYLLDKFRTDNGPPSLIKFKERLETSDELKRHFDLFAVWVKNSCQESNAASQNIDQITEACAKISKIIDRQIRRIYHLWYKHPRNKSPIR